MPLHGLTPETEALAEQVLGLVLARQRQDPWPLGNTTALSTLQEQVGCSITPQGLGAAEVMRRWVEHLDPATVAVDHPRYMAFIPHAPSEAAMVFDMLMGARSVYGGSWLEGAGATYAENEALRWLADLAGFPPEAGGTFVPGGTLGNLSALHAARETALAKRNGVRPARWQVAVSSEAHSSVMQSARVLDIDLLVVPLDEGHRLSGEQLRATLDAQAGDGLFAVSASAGATNLGNLDDLSGIAQVCRERGLWLHVDGAYGLAALVSPHMRPAFAGIEHADSFIVDPHKWLFAPYDSCALVYRDPSLARAAHSQHADYLDALNAREEWNPADYAVQLSRRARGLPFWFSLAAHGSDAYTVAVEQGLTLTQQVADYIRAQPHLDLLVEPVLTVLVFRRHGWKQADYDRWAADLLASGTAFVMPTIFQGEPAARLAFLNPRTSMEDVELVLAPMR